MKNFSPNLVILAVVLFLVSVSAVIYLKQRNSAIQPLPVPEKATTGNESIGSLTPAADTDAQATGSLEVNSTPDLKNPENSKPAQSPVPSSDLLEGFKYPGAKVTSTSANKIEMESSGDPSKISDWYKEKIRALNFNAKSFTQTNQNGVIFDKFSAAKPGEKIEVTIKKDQNVSTVTITVDRL